MCKLSHRRFIIVCEHVVFHNSFKNGNMCIDIDVLYVIIFYVYIFVRL